MNIDEFVRETEKSDGPLTSEKIAEFEASIGETLPNDYREFLSACNGGFLDGRLCCAYGSDEESVCIHRVGGIRDDVARFSLAARRITYSGRIPSDLLWIMDDPFGNAICLGIRGPHRGKVYFWDHEEEPDPDEWDGQVETAGNLELIAESFAEWSSAVPNPGHSWDAAVQMSGATSLMG